MSAGEIPDPIPNSEVKPGSADGTGLVTDRESRSTQRSLLFVFSAFYLLAPRGYVKMAHALGDGATAAQQTLDL